MQASALRLVALLVLGSCARPVRAPEASHPDQAASAPTADASTRAHHALDADAAAGLVAVQQGSDAGPADAGAPTEPARVGTYVFSRIYETSGLDTLVSVHPYDGGGWTFIVLADDSDPLARAAFEKLDVQLLGANDQAHTLFFCGILNEPAQTAATGESFRSFTLTHWYLSRPFASRSSGKQLRLRRRDFARDWDFKGDVALFHQPCSALPSSQRVARAGAASPRVATSP
jgi:hypothetical protein